MNDREEKILLAFEKLIFSLEKELMLARLSKRKYRKLALRQKAREYIYYSQDYELMDLILSRFDINKSWKEKSQWKAELATSRNNVIYYEWRGVLINRYRCIDNHREFVYDKWAWPSVIADLFRKWLLDWEDASLAFQILDCSRRVVKI